MNDKMKSKIQLPLIMTIIKYLFSFILLCVACVRVSSIHYFLIGLTELLMIGILSNILMGKKILGRIVNDILMLLYNAQMLVLMFANSYVTMLMLTNLDSVKALSGKAALYISSIVIMLIFTFLPITKCKLNIKINVLLGAGIVALDLFLIVVLGGVFSPMYRYAVLSLQFYDKIEFANKLEDAKEGKVSADVDFYKEGIVDYREKVSVLPEKPNVILIFTEGLSQNIVEDERGIMPNVQEYQRKSISFDNYYNHTFATYRGLIGQLYSGYQLNNDDTNALISIQSIFKNQGYNTFFINTEPDNDEFTAYLKSFGFDYLLGTKKDPCKGMADTISDKDAYEMIFDVAMEQEDSGEPFFLSIYTFGTHASFDSVNEKFQDGKDAELNKFYDVDYQFGTFMEKFENSPLAEDTIVVFTTDHATYMDDSFSGSFPEYTRYNTLLDRIPLFIYHKDVEPLKIDVAGRNSICLAPTILDYLDVSEPNYFIGTSLFSTEEPPLWETTCCVEFDAYNSRGGNLGLLNEVQGKEFDSFIKNYYITNAYVGSQK